MTHPNQPGLRERRAEFERMFTSAADALEAAIRTGASDGGEVITRLLATVAANLGGLHMVTAGRPGSWEADAVDQLLASTVGADGEYLLAYRTRPIEVVESVEEAMADAGLDCVYDETFTWIETFEHATVDTGATGYDAMLDRLTAAERLLEELRDADYAAYRSAFDQQIRDAAHELVATEHLPAAVAVRVRWVVPGATGLSRDEEWITIEHRLWEQARARTLLPGLAEDPWSPHASDPVAQLRASGQLPHQRIGELSRYHHLTGPSDLGNGRG